jgi:hypothetical protein
VYGSISGGYGSIVADAHHYGGHYGASRVSSRRIAVPQQVTRTVYTNVPEQHTVKEAYTSYRAKEVQTFKTEVVHDSKTIQIPRQATEEVQHTVYDVQTIKVPRTVVTHRPVFETITKQVQVPSVGYVDKVVMVPKTIMVPHTVRVPVRTHEVKEVQVKVPKIVHDERTVQVPRTIQVPQTVTVQEPVAEYRDRTITVNKAVPQQVTQTVLRKAKIPVYVQKHYSYHEGPAVSYGSGYVSGHHGGYVSGHNLANELGPRDRLGHYAAPGKHVVSAAPQPAAPTSAQEPVPKSFQYVLEFVIGATATC